MTLTSYQLDFGGYPELAAFMAADTPKSLKKTYARLKKTYKFINGSGMELIISPLEICAITGHLSQLNVVLANPGVINTISSWFTTPPLQAALEAAVYNGQVGVLNRLLEIKVVKSEVLFSLLNSAIQRGALNVVNRLLEFDAIRMAVAANNNEILCTAVLNGQMDIVNRLLEFEAVNIALTTDDNKVFRLVVLRNDVALANRLLEFPAVLRYAEIHEIEYQHYIHGFMQAKLNDLESRREAFVATEATASFDIAEPQVPLYFYILKNLIRRNDPTLDASINSLLTLSTLKERLHLPMAGGGPNELLRLAMRLGNTNAATALLGLPQVRALAETNNFYEEEIEHGELNLREVAANRESSMQALSIEQNRMKDSVYRHYRPKLDAMGGVAIVFESFTALLRQRYEEHPAKIVINGVERALPFEWAAFNALNLNASTREIALKAYYQHKDHTAYRYLSKPNFWIHPSASYVYVYDTNPALRYAVFEEYIPLITNFWLAASDSETPAISGYTLDGRIDLFIASIALMGRAHNWDRTRPTPDGTNEEYDDLEGDKPSCSNGVKGRLFQSVLGHPLFTQLTIEILKLELYDLIRDYFRAVIAAKTNEERRAIRSAVDEVFVELAEPADILKALNIPEVKKQAWIRGFSAKYGERFNNNPQFLIFINHTIAHAADESHVTKFYESHKLAAFIDAVVVPNREGRTARTIGWPTLRVTSGPTEVAGVDFSFYINCLVGVAGAILMFILLPPILLFVVTATVVGGGVAYYSLFSNGPSDKTEASAGANNPSRDRQEADFSIYSLP